jgi:hypothetical protein
MTSVVPKIITKKRGAVKAAGKTNSGGRSGIYPRHKVYRIDVGFSRWGTLSAKALLLLL